MSRSVFWALAFLLTIPVSLITAAGAQLRLRPNGTNLLIQIQGEPETDWHLQSSRDLVVWTNVNHLGPLLAGRSNAPSRVLGSPLEPEGYYRAVKTEGLYDPSLLRTIRLTFNQSNWQTLLASGRTSSSNTLCFLSMDNGATNTGVGARYKGNTSYTMGGTKKSINLEFDQTNTAANLMGFETVNLNNAAGDATLIREPLYFTTMEKYTPCPKGSMAKVFINGSYWGVYSLVQQENGQLINHWFPSNAGDRWRAPNIGGGGMGFNSGRSALSYLGTNLSSYRSSYELKTDHSTNAWSRLAHACDVLNNTPPTDLRLKVEKVLAVDRWLWFLAFENIFADDDSYWNKGADYGFYYEPESGRIHPIEHDGNEAFKAGDVSLSPVQGSSSTNRPVLFQLLAIPELRQRYLAHLRVVLEESYNPASMTPRIDQFVSLSVNDIMTDPVKNFSMATYTNEIRALKSFVTNRYSFLTNHSELRPLAPLIGAVSMAFPRPTAHQPGVISASVLPNGNNGVDSVWLYYRAAPYGPFTALPMFDDGAHGDGLAGDSVFGGATTNYPAGSKVRYYIEARSTNSARAASFAPPRAEQETFSYRVALSTATNTAVVINEVMASNTSTLADPQGDFDDWIELHNITDVEVDLTGHYLSDEPNNPRKWPIPAGTKIPPDGFLIVWADEDSTTTPGLHASFRLAGAGEQIFLTDTDSKENAVLDSVLFPALEEDRSYARSFSNPDVWLISTPTPDSANP